MFKISSVHRVFVAALLTFCAGFDGLSQYNLTIEQSAPAAAPGTVYRFYVEANDATDKMSAVFGNDQDAFGVLHARRHFQLCVEQRLECLWHQFGVVRFFP